MAKRDGGLVRYSVALLMLLVLGLFGCNARSSPGPSPLQKAAMQARPAVVRIETQVSLEWLLHDESLAQQMGDSTVTRRLKTTGTGFFVNPEGYIVTNAHVARYAIMSDQDIVRVFTRGFLSEIAEHKGVKSLSPAEEGAILKTLRYRNLRRKFVAITPGNEVLAADIKAFGTPYGESATGKDVAILKVQGSDFPTLRLAPVDKSAELDKVAVLGYPSGADSNTFSTDSYLEPTVSEGVVQAKKKSADDSPLLQVSAATGPGNSGGPVLSQDGSVIGILTMGVTSETIFWAVTSSTIQEFVRQAGITNTSGPVDNMYQQALAMFWHGQYSESMVKASQVLHLYPAHTAARRLIHDAELRRSEAGDQTPVGGPLVGAGVAALGAGVYLGLRTVRSRWRRRRAATQEAKVDDPAPPAAVPEDPDVASAEGAAASEPVPNPPDAGDHRPH